MSVTEVADSDRMGPGAPGSTREGSREAIVACHMQAAPWRASYQRNATGSSWSERKEEMGNKRNRRLYVVMTLKSWGIPNRRQ